MIGYSGMAYNIYGTWSNVSDRTLKKDIEPLRSAVGFVKALQPKTYNMKDCKWEHERGRNYGFIAQEVEEAMNATAGRRIT